MAADQSEQFGRTQFSERHRVTEVVRHKKVTGRFGRAVRRDHCTKKSGTQLEIRSPSSRCPICYGAMTDVKTAQQYGRSSARQANTHDITKKTLTIHISALEVVLS